MPVQARKFTHRLQHLQVLEKAVFSSHMIGLQLQKMKMCFINLHMRSWKNPLKAQTSVAKSQLFSTGDQSYEKKSFIFHFLAGVGVSVQRACLVNFCKTSISSISFFELAGSILAQILYSDFSKLGCLWELIIGETRCIVFDLKRYGE